MRLTSVSPDGEALVIGLLIVARVTRALQASSSDLSLGNKPLHLVGAPADIELDHSE